MAMYSHHPPDIQPANMIPAVFSPYMSHDYDTNEADSIGIDLTQLPLNLLALIIYYVSPLALEYFYVHELYLRLSCFLVRYELTRAAPSKISDPADLARACRTCRKLYYMCLPNLYTNVKLKSYDHIRFSNETARPEGCGGGSPFAMGLNALVIRPIAQYVRTFEVAGRYKEVGVEDHAKLGRVSDGGMMVNILVRTAIDRMTALDSFASVGNIIPSRLDVADC